MPVLGDMKNRTGSSLYSGTNHIKKNQRYMIPNAIKDIKVTRKIMMDKQMKFDGGVYV